MGRAMSEGQKEKSEVGQIKVMVCIDTQGKSCVGKSEHCKTGVEINTGHPNEGK